MAVLIAIAYLTAGCSQPSSDSSASVASLPPQPVSAPAPAPTWAEVRGGWIVAWDDPTALWLAIPEGSNLVVTFYLWSDDEALGFTVGCNSMGNKITGLDPLTVPNIQSTLMLCTPGFTQAEYRVTDFFGEPQIVAVDGNQMSIGSGAEQIVLQRQQ